MKYKWGICSLVMLASWNIFGQQVRGVDAGQTVDIRLDHSKPFAFLEVDHVGPRQALRDGEPHVGIWLRFRNNSKCPLVVVGFESVVNGHKYTENLDDEVVPNPSTSGTERAGSGIGFRPDQAQLTNIFLFPNFHEDEVRQAFESGKNDTRNADGAWPHGYNGGYQPGSQVLMVIPPGGAFFFSVPINHVSKAWHFEIPFRFAFRQEGTIRQPYSYLAFFWEDLPESYRKVHEAGHAPLP